MSMYQGLWLCEKTRTKCLEQLCCAIRAARRDIQRPIGSSNTNFCEEFKAIGTFSLLACGIT